MPRNPPLVIATADGGKCSKFRFVNDSLMRIKRYDPYGNPEYKDLRSCSRKTISYSFAWMLNLYFMIHIGIKSKRLLISVVWNRIWNNFMLYRSMAVLASINRNEKQITLNEKAANTKHFIKYTLWEKVLNHLIFCV